LLRGPEYSARVSGLLVFMLIFFLRVFGRFMNCCD
jgi:hypothetical protein